MENWVMRLLLKALQSATPAFLEALRTMAQNAVEQAKKTEDNPWDDFLANLFQAIVGKPGA